MKQHHRVKKRNETENKLKMSNMLVFCMWSVFVIWFQLFILACRAHSTSSLVFIVDAKISIVVQNWDRIQHYIKSIADEFDKSQSDIIEEYRIIQNGWFECELYFLSQSHSEFVLILDRHRAENFQK